MGRKVEKFEKHCSKRNKGELGSPHENQTYWKFRKRAVFIVTDSVQWNLIFALKTSQQHQQKLSFLLPNTRVFSNCSFSLRMINSTVNASTPQHQSNFWDHSRMWLVCSMTYSSNKKLFTRYQCLNKSLLFQAICPFDKYYCQTLVLEGRYVHKAFCKKPRTKAISTLPDGATAVLQLQHEQQSPIMRLHGKAKVFAFSRVISRQMKILYRL